MKQVVITGIGLATPIGCSKEDFLSNLCNGVMNLYPLNSLIDDTEINVKKACFVHNIDEEFEALNIDSMRFLDRANKLTLIAAKKSVLDSASEDCSEWNLVFGEPTTFGGICIESSVRIAEREGLSNLDPFFIPKKLPTTQLVQITKALGIHGYACNAAGVCTSGIHALITLYNQIQCGQCEIGLAGATDSAITRLSIKGFQSIHVISTNGNSVPFDKNRNGFILSEGSAFFVIESVEHAIKRRAKIYAEITGFASTSDGYDVLRQDPSGNYGKKAMIKSLKMAKLQSNDISAISAHGTGTIVNDMIESKNIKEIFGNVPVMAIKSCIGHTLGASGALSIAASLLCMNNNVIPGIRGYKEQSIDDASINISAITREHDINNIMINAYGFGGLNTSMILSKRGQTI